MAYEIENVEVILKKFDNLIDRQRLENNMGKACALVEADAKQKAPKGHGALRRSIESRVESTDTEIKGIVFSPLEYSAYVEMGTGLFAEKQGRKDVPWRYQDDDGKWHTTSGMKPQPYLRPALNENREEINRVLGEGITNV